MITRYTANIETFDGIDCIVHSSADKGDWVSYEDHALLIRLLSMSEEGLLEESNKLIDESRKLSRTILGRYEGEKPCKS